MTQRTKHLDDYGFRIGFSYSLKFFGDLDALTFLQIDCFSVKQEDGESESEECKEEMKEEDPSE